MTNRLAILAATVAAAITLTAAPAAAATSHIVVPRSHVSNRHAFHGGPNDITAPRDYYTLTFTARRAWSIHLYARDCRTTTLGDPGPYQTIIPAYLQVTATREAPPWNGPAVDQEMHGLHSAKLIEPMRAGRWTVYLETTCDWGLSVPNRVRYVVEHSR